MSHRGTFMDFRGRAQAIPGTVAKDKMVNIALQQNQQI